MSRSKYIGRPGCRTWAKSHIFDKTYGHLSSSYCAGNVITWRRFVVTASVESRLSPCCLWASGFISSCFYSARLTSWAGDSARIIPSAVITRATSRLVPTPACPTGRAPKSIPKSSALVLKPSSVESARRTFHCQLSHFCATPR